MFGKVNGSVPVSEGQSPGRGEAFTAVRVRKKHFGCLWLVRPHPVGHTSCFCFVPVKIMVLSVLSHCFATVT